MNNEQQNNNEQTNQDFTTPINGVTIVRPLAIPTSTKPPFFPKDFTKKSETKFRLKPRKN